MYILDLRLNWDHLWSTILFMGSEKVEGQGWGRQCWRPIWHSICEPLFQVFLGVQKAYDSLDRDWCMEILRGYGMGPNIAQLLENYWKWQRIVPKLGKCLRIAFGTGIGVTQGDPISPMIFNIVVDAVVRAVLEEV